MSESLGAAFDQCYATLPPGVPFMQERARQNMAACLIDSMGGEGAGHTSNVGGSGPPGRNVEIDPDETPDDIEDDLTYHTPEQFV